MAGNELLRRDGGIPWSGQDRNDCCVNAAGATVEIVGLVVLGVDASRSETPRRGGRCQARPGAVRAFSPARAWPEVVDLRVSNLALNPQPRVHLHGKGNKWRVCPLWTQTASLLEQLLEQRSIGDQPKAAVFASNRGQALTRYGIFKVVRRHTEHLGLQRSDGKRRRVSPHVFRHSTAAHLLESGVEVNLIRGWLGHVSLETTNRYAEINIRMKEAALKACEAPTSASEGFPRKPVWRDDPSLLKWLQSL
jgi:integrase/recombinase XerD